MPQYGDTLEVEHAGPLTTISAQEAPSRWRAEIRDTHSEMIGRGFGLSRQAAIADARDSAGLPHGPKCAGRPAPGAAFTAWAERQRVDIWALVLAALIITVIALVCYEAWESGVVLVALGDAA